MTSCCSRVSRTRRGLPFVGAPGYRETEGGRFSQKNYGRIGRGETSLGEIRRNVERVGSNILIPESIAKRKHNRKGGLLTLNNIFGIVSESGGQEKINGRELAHSIRGCGLEKRKGLGLRGFTHSGISMNQDWGGKGANRSGGGQIQGDQGPARLRAWKGRPHKSDPKKTRRRKEP